MAVARNLPRTRPVVIAPSPSRARAAPEFRSKVGEMTIGDYLRPLGIATACRQDSHGGGLGWAWRGLASTRFRSNACIIASAALNLMNATTDYALEPDGPMICRYNEYLRDLGYDADNPWHDYANAAAGEDGEIASGWLMRNASKPARVEAGAFRDRLYDATARCEFMRRGRRRSRGACTSPTSSRTGPISRRRRADCTPV